MENKYNHCNKIYRNVFIDLLKHYKKSLRTDYSLGIINNTYYEKQIFQINFILENIGKV